MAIKASFSPGSGILSVFDDNLNNTIVVSRNAAGTNSHQRRCGPCHGRHIDGS